MNVGIEPILFIMTVINSPPLAVTSVPFCINVDVCRCSERSRKRLCDSGTAMGATKSMNAMAQRAYNYDESMKMHAGSLTREGEESLAESTATKKHLNSKS